MLSIPMRGDIESLNASVAAGILMYLFMEGRK
jgi:tRNA G18 (ribose-2'-O)-methylase SpoU